ncbi:MAG: hypothetical protein WC356_01585 [Candidatus Micrarchaeia archaeon]
MANLRGRIQKAESNNLLGQEESELQKEIEYYREHGFRDDKDLLGFIARAYPDKSGNPLTIPRAHVCEHHNSPADYICDTFFERVQNSICWSNRGGGKTLLAGLCTWLDSAFKGGCSTKILGGSQEQSKRVYEHLTGEGDGWGLVTEDFQYLLNGEMLAQGSKLNNQSNIQILTASSRSVRGAHPQKMKLDEVDEMDPSIYQAALLVPQTKRGIKSSLQIFSTMHKAYGLMNQVITEADERGYRVYKWCIFDVIERCTPDRECALCELWPDCQGKARAADGFYGIEDAITKRRQVSVDTWNSEMLCNKPSQEGLIYGEFDWLLHVQDPPKRDDEDPEGGGGEGAAGL